MYDEFMKVIVEGRKRRLYPWEMVGFDILLDRDFRTYVLEINNSPSVAPHTELENKIKRTLLKDLFDLVDVENKKFYRPDRIADSRWTWLNRYRQDNWNQTIISSAGLPFNLADIKTKEDLWTIAETELENERKGSFQRAFPAIGGEKYLRYLENPRNKLIMKWVSAGMKLKDLSDNKDKDEL